VGVEVLDLEGVVEDIAADLFAIRKERRNVYVF